MNIIFIRSNSVSPDSRVEKEVNSLLNYGHNVEVLAWDRDANYELESSILRLPDNTTTIYRVGIKSTFGGGMKKNLIPLLKFQRVIYNFIIKNKESYDVIHACDFDTAFIANLARKKTKHKFVYDIFDYYIDAFNIPKSLKPIIEKQDSKIINSSEATIICSEKRREQIRNTSPKYLEIIHNSPPYSSNIPILNLNENKFKIVYVGILSEGRMIKELCEIVAQNNDYELHIAGFGQYEKEIREISQNNKNIFFYGKIPYKKTLELENSCDLMTAIYDPNIINHQYAAPNKFYEALMLGKPIIMIRDTGMSEVVSSNELGKVIEFNKESLESAIQELSKIDKTELDELKKKSKRLYNKYYSWEVMEERLINLYKRIT